MATTFSTAQHELLNLKTIAIVSVISPNGFPYQTPIWFVEYKDKIYFSTETTRTKGKFLAKNKHIGINITHPNGFPYISIVGKAQLFKKNDFRDYREVLSLLFDRYTKPEDKEKGIQSNLNNKNRILVEINPIRVIFPSK